jgi:hypothetical protein
MAPPGIEVTANACGAVHAHDSEHATRERDLTPARVDCLVAG